MHRLLKVSPLLLALILFGSCSLVAPLPRETTLQDRLAVFPESFPVDGVVTVYWDKHQVPFIEAEHDRDLAFTLGLVHAHLRGGQAELLRRASQGRLAEGMGGYLVPVDHAMRLLDFSRTTPEIIASMPPDTREFLEQFAGGMTWYQERQQAKPVEHRVLRWDFEPWTVEDLVTMSRLASIDITWMYAFRSLTLQQDPNWEAYWTRVQKLSGESIPTFEGPELISQLIDEEGGTATTAAPSVDALEADRAMAFLRMVLNQSRSGSNVMAVSHGPSDENRPPLLAADPHVGLQIPPLWLLVGMKSPSYNAVGFMLPGFPVVAIGRNAHGAWGGTNMLAQSSDFVELPENWEVVSTREERIGVRGWLNRKVTLRESEWGPVISDLPLFPDGPDQPDIALRWVGREPSDEFTALLGVVRSTDWNSFRQAFETWSVSGQNMVYAGNDGTIGHVLAARLPKRPPNSQPWFSISTDEADAWWAETLGPLDLPTHSSREPSFLVSTNNRPARHQPVIVSRFHDSNDRQGRLIDLLEKAEYLDLETLAEIQKDVVSPEYLALIQDILEIADGSHEEILGDLRDWDGAFSSDSRGALVAHLLIGNLARLYFPEKLGDSIGNSLLSSGLATSFLVEDLADAVHREEVATRIPTAMDHTLQDLRFLKSDATWGDFHRLHVAHPFSNLPLVGNRYRFGNHPAEGNTNTVRKAAGPLSNEPGRATYGQNGRALFDLADPDANHFVLFGGQDGWLNSTTSTDQVDLFLAGEMITLPLHPESPRAGWVHITRATSSGQ
ncbi:MAG: penicillin acylase family protein [Candidatus Sumerlaeia bacterium]|nr:penicillin acylase family protein [Candidatus Sumerlaeia bacterium]